MITIQEQVSDFKMKCEKTFDKRKQKNSAGIKVPIPDLEDVCVEFCAGERYVFGGERGTAYLRNLLLWQLARQGNRICINSSRAQFEMDFLDLLQKESGVPSWHIASGYFGKGEQRSVLEVLEKIRTWRVAWIGVVETDSNTDMEEKTYFLFSFIQASDIPSLKADKNAVNFFFVQESIPPERKEDFWGCGDMLRFPNTLAEYFCYAQGRINVERRLIIDLLLRDTNRLKRRECAILLDVLGRYMGPERAEDIEKK